MKILSTAIALMLPCCPLQAQDDFGTLIFNHQISTGMTFGNVQAAWGRPRTIDRSFSDTGTVEYWWFNNGWLVVFVNGRVTRFSHFGQ